MRNGAAGQGMANANGEQNAMESNRVAMHESHSLGWQARRPRRAPRKAQAHRAPCLDQSFTAHCTRDSPLREPLTWASAARAQAAALPLGSRLGADVTESTTGRNPGAP